MRYATGQRLLTVSLEILLSGFTLAQVKPDTITPTHRQLTAGYAPAIIPPSPNAASMGRYGDLPVNLSSGLPIPNFTLFAEADKDINWSVGLSYNYPGFMPASEAGPLGHGWTLLGGGTITRTIRGFEDEKNQGQGGQQGYYYSRTQISNLLDANGKVICSGNACPDGFTANQLDGQPDLFAFQMSGISGQFFIGEDGQFKVVSDRSCRFSGCSAKPPPPSTACLPITSWASASSPKTAPPIPSGCQAVRSGR